MSISRRIATLSRVRANKALDRAEDPREILDYSYEPAAAWADWARLSAG